MYLCTNKINVVMKIGKEFKVRTVCGENIVVNQGEGVADMISVIALNASALYLWNELTDKDFQLDDVVALLTDKYDVDEATAKADAEKWIASMKECKILND